MGGQPARAPHGCGHAGCPLCRDACSGGEKRLRFTHTPLASDGPQVWRCPQGTAAFLSPGKGSAGTSRSPAPGCELNQKEVLGPKPLIDGVTLAKGCNINNINTNTVQQSWYLRL